MEHNKDQDVLQAYSMINDTVARVGSNIEEECHDWFEDTSRLADKIGATVQESLGGRNKVSSANPHLIIVLTLPYLLQIIYWNKLVQDSAKTTGLGSKLFPWFHLLR